MAEVGTTVAGINDPSVKTWTWTVASGLAAGNASGPLDLRGMESVRWYVTSITGYVSGNHVIGASLDATTSGALSNDPGDHIRSIYTANPVAGYVRHPPPTMHLLIITLGTTPTAVTVKIVARGASNRPRNAT